MSIFTAILLTRRIVCCTGYRGVIYGHDLECSAPEGWQQQMKIDSLPEGRKQPFYHVLVDVRDRPGGMSTYVAQENMSLQPTPRPVLHPWTNMVRKRHTKLLVLRVAVSLNDVVSLSENAVSDSHLSWRKVDYLSKRVG